MTPHPIAMRAGLARDVVARVFVERGRVHVPDFLKPDCAKGIYRTLAQDTPWQLSLNPAGRHMDLGVEDIEQIPEPQRAAVIQGLHQGPRDGFRYVFNNFPLYDLYEAGSYHDHPLMAVYQFVNSEPFLEFVRAVSGIADIAYADAQATRYRPGHFLTVHDDDVHGKHRRVAYVLGFTPDWRADWGGVLQFIDGDGHVLEGYAPVFNSLNLLRVPQKHSVSYVTPSASGSRYSITGWLRAID